MTLSPRTRRRQQRLARWVRRAPGLRPALDRLLPRIRGSAVLTDLVWRVFAPRHGAGHQEVPLLRDRHLTGPHLDLLPLVGVLGTGLTDELAEQLLDEVAELQEETGTFRPVLVLDRPVFAAARRHGYVLEVLTPRSGWPGGDVGATDEVAEVAEAAEVGEVAEVGQVAWGDYVGTRLASIVHHYQLWHVIEVPAPTQEDGPHPAAPHPAAPNPARGTQDGSATPVLREQDRAFLRALAPRVTHALATDPQSRS